MEIQTVVPISDASLALFGVNSAAKQQVLRRRVSSGVFKEGVDYKVISSPKSKYKRLGFYVHACREALRK